MVYGPADDLFNSQHWDHWAMLVLLLLGGAVGYGQAAVEDQRRLQARRRPGQNEHLADRPAVQSASGRVRKPMKKKSSRRSRQERLTAVRRNGAGRRTEPRMGSEHSKRELQRRGERRGAPAIATSSSSRHR